MQLRSQSLLVASGVTLPLAAKALEPLPVRYGGGDDQFADCYLQDGERPVVVLLHGGYWRASYGKSLRVTSSFSLKRTPTMSFAPSRTWDSIRFIAVASQ